MTTHRPLSTHSARNLAARLRHARRAGRGWSNTPDRDLARESHELMVLSHTQASHDRLH